MTKREMDLDGYELAIAGMNEFGIALSGMLREMLRHQGVDVHTIHYRVKAKESATRKIETADGVYGGYEELHDLLGLRITCYFTDEVERVADIIDKQFHPDPTKSEDKRDKLGPTEFGYRSVHRVASLGRERTKLVEYERFKNLRFEVQIRTVLQHAWAEIEHDLGYKAETIPAPMRRRFSMLAGVLELVDYEFQTLRGELTRYEEKAERAANNSATNMALDIATLASLLRRDDAVVFLDKGVADAAKRRLGKLPPGPGPLESRLQRLRSVGINTISELREAAVEWRPHVLAFVPVWIERVNERRREEGEPIPGGFPQSVGLFYLYFAMTLESMRRGNGGTLEENLLKLNPLEIWESTVERVGEPPAI